jgi:hypothetical protein
MILYLKDPKNSFKNKNLLDLTSTFINIAGYKINKQKSVVFLYTNFELSESEIRKNMPLTIHKQTNKKVLQTNCISM